MIKVVFALRRKQGMSVAEFQDYWKNVHGPLVRGRVEAIGASRYVQVRTIEDPINARLRSSREGSLEAFDGIAEMYWDSRESFDASWAVVGAREAGIEFLADERNFIDFSGSAIWVAEDDEIFPGR
jgi:uncharacterized protein (TIGR02118 family)